jgi:hypothetical protein
MPPPALPPQACHRTSLPVLPSGVQGRIGRGGHRAHLSQRDHRQPASPLPRLLNNPSECGPATSRWPGNYKASSWVLSDDFRVGFVLQANSSASWRRWARRTRTWPAGSPTTSARDIQQLLPEVLARLRALTTAACPTRSTRVRPEEPGTRHPEATSRSQAHPIPAREH